VFCADEHGNFLCTTGSLVRCVLSTRARKAPLYERLTCKMSAFQESMEDFSLRPPRLQPGGRLRNVKKGARVSILGVVESRISQSVSGRQTRNWTLSWSRLHSQRSTLWNKISNKPVGRLWRASRAFFPRSVNYSRQSDISYFLAQIETLIS